MYGVGLDSGGKGDDGLDSGGDGYGDGEDVINEYSGAGDLAPFGAKVIGADDVGSSGFWVGVDCLVVAKNNGKKENGEGDGNPGEGGISGHAEPEGWSGKDEDKEDFFGGVGDAGEGIGSKDGESEGDGELLVVGVAFVNRLAEEKVFEIDFAHSVE